MSTNFQRVSKFNRAIGNVAGVTTRMDKQLEIIVSEVRELVRAIAERDFTEIRDGICDVLVTTHGLGHIMGVDVDKDMEVVCDSNDSKFLYSASQAQTAAEQMYKEKGFPIIAREATPNVWALIAAEDGPDAPKGKLMKGPNFKPPVFPILEAPDMPPVPKDAMATTMAIVVGRLYGDDDDTLETYPGMSIDEAITKFKEDIARDNCYSTYDTMVEECGEHGEVYITNTAVVTGVDLKVEG